MYMGERIARNLRKDYFEKIVRKDIQFFDEKRTGDLVSRLNSDVQVVQDTLSSNASMFLRSFLFIVASLVIMCFISLKLTGVTFAGIIPLVIFS